MTIGTRQFAHAISAILSALLLAAVTSRLLRDLEADACALARWADDGGPVVKSDT